MEIQKVSQGVLTSTLLAMVNAVQDVECPLPTCKSQKTVMCIGGSIHDMRLAVSIASTVATVAVNEFIAGKNSFDYSQNSALRLSSLN